MSHRFPNQSFQPNQNIPNRGMRGSGMNSNQGFQPNRSLSNRGMPGNEMNSNQGFQSNQSVPNRGMRGSGMNSNQGFQPNQNMSNRGMPGNVNQGFQSDQIMHNRDMSGPGMNTNQGFQPDQRSMPNRSMSGPRMNSNQGFHSDQSISNRSMSGPRMNSNQGFHSDQSISNRGMSGPRMNSNQGFHSDQSISNRGMSGHEMNSNQDFQSNQGMHNRGMSDLGMNSNQGFQSNQSMPSRGMSGPGMNSNQGFQSNQSMPSRGMSGHGMNTNQGFQTDQGMPNRGMPGPSINTQGMYNQLCGNQGMPRGNVPISPVQGNEQFQMQQGIQFDGNPQGQMGSVGMQHGSVPQNPIPQGPIVQHVMIPVPVPVGAEIPPHLLRPQIITSTGPGLPNQGSQSHGQFPQIQGQGQMTGMQGQFPSTQGQFQGHDQTPNMPVQSNFTGFQGEGQFQKSKPGFQSSNLNAPVRGSGVDDLSYYMGNESRNANKDRAGESTYRSGDQDFKQSQPQLTPGEIHARRAAKAAENRHRSQERRFQIQQRIAQEQELERNRSEQSRSRSSSKHSYTSEHVERSEQDFHRKTIDNSGYNREQVDSYRRHDDHVVKNQEIRNTGQFFKNERDNVFESRERYEREQKSGPQMDYERQEEYNERVSRMKDYEKNQRPNRQAEFDQNDSYKTQANYQRYTGHVKYEGGQSYSKNDNVDYENNLEDVRNVQHSGTNDYKGKQRIESERHSGAVLYTDGSREELESSDRPNYRDNYRNESEKHPEVILFTDGKRENFEGVNTQEYRDKQRNEFEQSSAAILYRDGKREDLECRGIERYDREKRKHSPVSSERSSRKLKRDYSPVSESKSHGDLKIHISDRGRWIETDRNLSPVSDGEDDRFEDERDRADRNIYSAKKTDFERNSLDGAEMVSDSESYIGDISKAEITIHAQDLSPVSQQSSRYESQRFDGGSEYGKYQGAERISPSRSSRSRHSEERRSHSHRSRNSEDRQRERGPSQGSFELKGRISDQRSQQPDKRLDFQLHVPDLCPAHNQKGCHWEGCTNFHICKFYVIDLCKFGEYCTKGHDIFKGHPYETLSKINPGFRHSNVTAEQVKLILKKRISNEPLPKELEHRLTTYKIVRPETAGSPPRELKQKVTSFKTDQSCMEPQPRATPYQTKKEISPLREPENVVAVDPSFDARNYAPGNFVKVFDEKEELKKNQSKAKSDKKDIVDARTKIGRKASDKEQKGTMNQTGSERKRPYSLQRNKDSQGALKSSGSENRKENYKKKDTYNLKQKNENSPEKKRKQSKTDKTQNESMLSPVSGDEDDWEKYEKYEKISEDGMSEKEDGLDNVSSDDSIEQVQVNRSVDSFPLPTPENIAVPIGMNDPLVFNRPLKNNPQSYIGPLNRPPPMFPIAANNNAPLFPVVQQNQNLVAGSTGGALQGFSGVPGPTPGLLPNHLPSPEFMKQVIQNLPSFKVESSEQKNVFKNDNNPASTETNPPKKKIKSDKVERDPELKETIKKLWKFPHKGVVNMSIIEFVTETEAYKEELIAEIVKILVTLELPYVTMRKLLSVIKEKVSINIKSETDLRKILDMYPHNFKIIEMVDSDDESDELDTKKNVQIKANIGIGFCEKHGFLPFAIGKCECNALHLCKFYFLSDCPIKHCKFGHKLKTDHNVAVLKQHKLHRLTGEEIMNFLADEDNRNKETIPSICKYYVREKGCYKGDNTDYETVCHSLHLCSYILKGKCMNRECDRSHSIHDKQPLSLLQKYGLDPNELGDEKVLQMLGEKCIENEKGKKSGTFKQSQQPRSSVKSRAVSGSNKANKDSESSTVEGLPILTRSETRISSKYFVQNFKAPSVCKFYQNALGCRKKDWGADGKCFFLHICQHYVAGECNYGDKCKRSHDLFSGQAAEILQKYNFDLQKMTANDILERLNSNSGAPVELPNSEDSPLVDNEKEKIEITIDSVGEPDEIDESNFEIPPHPMEIETRVNVEENDGFTSETEVTPKKVNDSDGKSSSKSANKNTSSFESRNIEDVIKHIMEHNKVDKK
ncbi:uncharacterized protein LOC123554684 [Mercenaria mercenaria]|uniref:uncharacterized protein LOC123554684 n=1 Tax=Mercenaria mercenaria TaxID=6596 RepID=UPI00234ED628|nr:uncharacterized protein LOC123554684 [Mercenaria mercenaria]XP_045200897.2 uncharacterized protein LOC123554684 [Mercenaria mercenaria]